jgi:Tol biopolymer transport system component
MGGAWSRNGTILFSPTSSSPLYSVPDTGSSPMVEVTQLMNGHTSHRFPDFLPDGRHFLFFVDGGTDVQGVYIGSLENKEIRRVLASDSAAVFLEPDYILFRRFEGLMAQRLDLKKFVVFGDSFSVAPDVSGVEGTRGEVAVSTSTTGKIAYRAEMRTPRQLTWFDRDGGKTGTLFGVDPFIEGFRISPDGRSVAVERRIKGNLDVYLIETARGILRRITSDPESDANPVWDPQRNRIAFASRRSGAAKIWIENLDSGTEEGPWESVANQGLQDWSSKGRLLFGGGSPFTRALEDEKRMPLTSTGGVANGRFSPDGNWFAYKAQTGFDIARFEVFVMPVSGLKLPKQVSTTGGGFPRWTKDGQEILFWGKGSHLTAVNVTLKPNGEIESGTPTPLGLKIESGEGSFDVTPDGQRILINKLVGSDTPPPITIIENWKPKP